jgi:hypothetical protein
MFDLVIIYLRSKLGSIKLYGVIDWTNLSKELYENQLKTNSEFETSFASLAYMINYLFGNEAIVVLIKNIYDNDNFEKDILKFKKEIREKYSESDKLYLLINLAKVKEINTDKTKTSEIILKDKSR